MEKIGRRRFWLVAYEGATSLTLEDFQHRTAELKDVQSTWNGKHHFLLLHFTEQTKKRCHETVVFLREALGEKKPEKLWLEGFDSEDHVYVDHDELRSTPGFVRYISSLNASVEKKITLGLLNPGPKLPGIVPVGRSVLMAVISALEDTQAQMEGQSVTLKRIVGDLGKMGDDMWANANRVGKQADKLRAYLKRKPEEIEESDDEPRRLPVLPDGVPEISRPASRGPIKLSLLRKGSISELFFAGLMVPEWNFQDVYYGGLCPKMERIPARLRKFRSQIGEGYIEGYDVDDITFSESARAWEDRIASNPLPPHPPIALMNSAQTAHAFQYPNGVNPMLESLYRHGSISVLYEFRLFYPGFDENDEYAGPYPGRLPIVWSKHATKMGYTGSASANARSGRFIPGYDVDDGKDTKTVCESVWKGLTQIKERLDKKRAYKIQKVKEGVPEHEIEDDPSLDIV